MSDDDEPPKGTPPVAHFRWRQNGLILNSNLPLSTTSVNTSWSACEDRWLELRLSFLRALHRRFGAGPISHHYLAAATRSYGEYCATCDGFYRFAAWRAVQACCQWLAQRKERG
jgi:hypothetical protein